MPLFLCLVLFPVGNAWSIDDAYLSDLAAEAEKVEERSIGEEDETSSTDSSAGEQASEADVEASRAAFERQLKKNYRGSYGFYTKLPERSRQEVFEEYRQGADMKEIRKKIINRLLHR